MKSLFAAKDLQVELSLPAPPGTAYGDANGLRRLLACSSTQKYGPHNGQIRITIRSDESEVELTVADTGCGIPESELSRIFERFYRVDSSRYRKTGGYGLGLAIAQQVAEAHQGRLDAVNLPGRGTLFRFRMPGLRDPQGCKARDG